MSINLRSMIFVPGYRRRFLERSRRFMADALILDLEDSVPHADKE
ncbi:MAG TPA: CoA ester lyase, partial [Acidimicrobiaceae bacterium]|nr:CoA ester lyase [Acidimicrobiaceae bacterium]